MKIELTSIILLANDHLLSSITAFMIINKYLNTGTICLLSSKDSVLSDAESTGLNIFIDIITITKASKQF